MGKSSDLNPAMVKQLADELKKCSKAELLKAQLDDCLDKIVHMYTENGIKIIYTQENRKLIAKADDLRAQIERLRKN